MRVRAGTPALAAVKPPLTLEQTLGMLTARLPLDALVPDSEEMLYNGGDPTRGQRCARYRGGLDVARGMLDGTGRPTTPDAVAAEAAPVVERMRAQGYIFTSSKAQVWLCPDGYIHQISAEVHGEQAGKPCDGLVGLSVSYANDPIPIHIPSEALTAGPKNPAEVFNGGNVRAEPSLQAPVRGQIHAGEVVSLRAKTPDERWYLIVNPRGVEGWVSATLLTIDPAVAAEVPTP